MATSPEQWAGIFNTIDDEADETPQELRAKIKRLQDEILELRRGGDPMRHFLAAAEGRGFVIQLIPARIYQMPKEG